MGSWLRVCGAPGAFSSSERRLKMKTMMKLLGIELAKTLILWIGKKLGLVVTDVDKTDCE